ncbi:MAG: phage major capsid protein [Dehalogenimonas sp.]
MAINTLVEANKYSNTTLKSGVIDLLVKDDAIFNRLPFETLVGNSLTYDRKTTGSTANFYAPGDEWQEDTMTIEQVTAVLKILGGDADVDKFIAKTRSNINDVKALVLAEKTMAVKDTFKDRFFYGNATSNVKEFDGAHVLISSTTYNTVHAGSGTGSALSIAKLREAIDMVRQPFSPKLLVMTRKMRRLLSTYLDSVGTAYPTDRDEFGMFMQKFDGIPIAVDDSITDTETASSGAFAAKIGGDCTSIFIFDFGPSAMCGLQSGEMEVTDLGELETKNATRTRICWYPSLKLEHLRSCAKVDGILTTSAVTA